jgi:hypothetical protein
MAENEGVFSNADLYHVVQYMIEADEESGEFFETENGTMVPMFWSNDLGWVPFFFADSFSEKEYFEVNLPQGGRWVKVTKHSTAIVSNSLYVTQETCGIVRNFQVMPSENTEERFRIV